MDAMKNLLTLRSTREFADRPIPDDVMNAILEAARWTGSSRNSQPWQFVVIRNSATLQKLAEIIPYGKHLAGAPAAIAIVIEGEGRGQSLDAGRVSQSIHLAAHAQGVGSCIATISEAEPEKQALTLLGIPPTHSMRVAISLGYPRPLSAEERSARANRPNRGRKPLDELVHYDRYGGKRRHITPGTGRALRALVMSDERAAARDAGLRYVSDLAPGIRRKRAGKSFTYLDADGKRVEDAETLKRVKSLAIPPAWSDVRICPSPRGHLQATGRDARGRKQYKYHPTWRQKRDEAKYERLLAFGQALPTMRARAEEDLARPGLGREKVLGAVVRLLEGTLVRVGNREYARQNRSFGLTTMRDRHARIDGTGLRFEFTGKGGKRWAVGLRDRRLANVVRRCQELPGQELFQYLDESGERRTVESADVNQYLREIAGQEFTAKDFRTWAGTVLAAQALAEIQELDPEAARSSSVVRAVEQVAERLGNTPTICRKCYVHPAVIEAFLDGTTIGTIRARLADELEETGLSAEEALVMALLRQRLKEPRKAA